MPRFKQLLRPQFDPPDLSGEADETRSEIEAFRIEDGASIDSLHSAALAFLVFDNDSWYDLADSDVATSLAAWTADDDVNYAQVFALLAGTARSDWAEFLGRFEQITALWLEHATTAQADENPDWAENGMIPGTRYYKYDAGSAQWVYSDDAASTDDWQSLEERYAALDQQHDEQVDQAPPASPEILEYGLGFTKLDGDNWVFGSSPDAQAWYADYYQMLDVENVGQPGDGGSAEEVRRLGSVWERVAADGSRAYGLMQDGPWVLTDVGEAELRQEIADKAVVVLMSNHPGLSESEIRPRVARAVLETAL